MKAFTLINEKGGVGKTTCALHIAAGLALRDKRVLLIDTSAQGHCAQQLAVGKFGGLYRLLVQQAEWKDVLREPEAAHWSGRLPTIGRLLLLPSNAETRAIPLMISDPLALRARLQELADSIDVVVIDTPPEPSLLHAVIYAATDAVIYPTKCEALSLDGLAEAMDHIHAQNEARKAFGLRPVRLLGVLPTMYRDTNSNSFAREKLEQHFGAAKVWPSIPLRTIWTDREYAHKTLYAFAPDDVATQEFDRNVVERMLPYATE